MKKLRYLALLFLCLCIWPSYLVAQSEADTDAFRAKLLATVYIQSCFLHASEPAKVETVFAPGGKYSSPPMPDKNVRHFLRAGESGKGWVLRNLGAIVVLRENGLCTLFIQKIDSDIFLREFFSEFHKWNHKIYEVGSPKLTRMGTPNELNTAVYPLKPIGILRDGLDQRGVELSHLYEFVISTTKREGANFQVALSIANNF